MKSTLTIAAATIVACLITLAATAGFSPRRARHYCVDGLYTTSCTNDGGATWFVFDAPLKVPAASGVTHLHEAEGR